MKPHRLSKSRMISGIQCEKRLWLETHRRDLLEVSPAQQMLFDTGHRVGEVAQSLFPGGWLVRHDTDLAEAIRETHDVLNTEPERPIFEATFNHDDVLVRCDILVPEAGGLRMIEVKAATSVKEYHLWDCAIQNWVLSGAGLKLGRIELAHIDTAFVYPGGQDYNGLFHFEDVGAQIGLFADKVPRWSERFKAVLAGGEPDIAVGPQCSDPFDCPFIGYCRPKGPEYPVAGLPGARAELIGQLKANGYADIRDIPAGVLTNDRQEWVRRVTVSGAPDVDPGLGKHLGTLPYPRYYLDFETAGPAVPIWPGTRPYQNRIPFQWSCHIEAQPGCLGHADFLDLTGENPTRPCAEALIAALGDTGPVFVYSSFEKTVLSALAEFHPDLQPALEALKNRLVDLLPLVKAHYYHPDMHGSWSIKSVLPTVAPDLNYDALEEVHDGTGAQAAYYEAIELPDGTPRKEAVRKNLLKYCEMDSLAMVKVVKFFETGQS